MEAGVLACGLVLYSSALNLWPPFNRTLFVPMNLVACGVVTALGLGPLGLSLEQIGLAGMDIRDAALGLAAGTLLAAPLFALLASNVTAQWIADKRVTGLSGRGLAYQVLVRIPLGTVLLEEVAFRGVLLAAWQPGGTARAALSSVAFGLWHVSPALNMVAANRPHAAATGRLAVVGGTVLLTSLAGVALVWLRIASGSLAAPALLHASLNGLATIAGVLAGRSVRAGPAKARYRLPLRP